MKKIKKGSKSEIVENRDGNSQKQKKKKQDHPGSSTSSTVLKDPLYLMIIEEKNENEITNVV